MPGRGNPAPAEGGYRAGRGRLLLAGLVVYLGAGSVLLHRLDPVQGRLLVLVGLTRRDHLPVGGDEVEVVLAARALLHHELARHASSFGRPRPAPRPRPADVNPVGTCPRAVRAKAMLATVLDDPGGHLRRRPGRSRLGPDGRVAARGPGGARSRAAASRAR